MLAKVKWINSTIRLGCDTPKQIEECERVIELIWKDYPGACFLMYTMISGSLEENYERLTHFRGRSKIRIVAQPFRNPLSPNDPPQWQKDMARWAMRREYFMSCDFKDFRPRKNFVCSSYFNDLNK